MSDELTEVQAGDVIKASLYNDLVERIRSLEERIEGMPDEMVTVPDFVGQRLGYSVDLVGQPNVFLSVGSVFDPFGNSVTPTGPDNRARIVISQMPRPGARVSKGTTVDLLVAAKVSSNGGDGGPPPVLQPIINEITPPSQHIGLPITIVGENFSTNPDEITVQIDGEVASPIQNLDVDSMEVTVPTSVEDPESNNNASRDVNISVTVLGNTATFSGFTILPPQEEPVPTILGVNTQQHHPQNPEGRAREGQKIVVIGDGFTASKENTQVEFIRSGASNKTASADEIRQDVNEDDRDEIDIVIPDLGLEGSDEQAFDLKVVITGENPRSSSTFDSRENGFFIGAAS